MDQRTRVASRLTARIRLWAFLAEALGAFITALLIGAFGVFRLDFWHLRHPVLFGGDVGIMLEYIKNGLQNGGVDIDPQLGWPFHSGLASFPVLDNLSAGVVRILSLVTKDPATGDNLLIYVDHLLSGVVGYFCFRALRIPRVCAVACGVAFAWAEFALEPSRVVAHVSLQLIAPLAVGATLALLPAARPNVLTERWVWIGSLVGAGFVGLGQPYWAAFASLVITISIVGCLTAGRFRAVYLLTASIGTTLVVAAACLAWPRFLGEPSIPIDRSPYQQPILGLRLVNLLIPPHSTLLPGVDRFYGNFLANSGSVSEGFDAFLGWAGLLGLTAGLVLLVRLPFRRKTSFTFVASEVAAVLLIVTILFAHSYGLGEVFNLFVIPDIRAQNRVSPLIAFLALFIFADTITRLGETRHTNRLVHTAAVVLIIAVSLWDRSSDIDYAMLQTAPETTQRWNEAKENASRIEEILPSGSTIFQLPTMLFPENPPIASLGTYEQMYIALFTKNYHFSFGAVQGTPSYIDQSTPVVEAIGAAAIGYDELLFYKSGYPSGVAESKAEIQKELSIETNIDTESLLGFNLKPLRDGLASIDPEVLRLSIDWERHGFSVLERDGRTPVRWDDSADGKAVVTLENPSSVSVPMRFCSIIAPAIPGLYQSSIEAAGQIARLPVGPGGVKADIVFDAPPGRSFLSVSVPAPRLPTPADPRHIHFQLRDPVLEPVAIEDRRREIAKHARVPIPNRCH